jgi:DNA-directed RNA polymerase subunit RPC12/RpoP
MEGEEDGSGSAVQRPPPQQQQIRVVRCPKCDKLLPELPNYSVYVCGGCGATLQGWCISHLFSICNHYLPYFSAVLIGHPFLLAVPIPLAFLLN